MFSIVITFHLKEALLRRQDLWSTFFTFCAKLSHSNATNECLNNTKFRRRNIWPHTRCRGCDSKLPPKKTTKIAKEITNEINKNFGNGRARCEPEKYAFSVARINVGEIFFAHKTARPKRGELARIKSFEFITFNLRNVIYSASGGGSGSTSTESFIADIKNKR